MSRRPNGQLVHGKASGYTNHGCRCEACTKAMKAARDRWIASLADRPSSQIPHGTSSGYSCWGCRCGSCTEARRLEAAASRARARRRRLAVTGLVAMAAGVAGTNGVILATRHAPAVTRPAPRPNPSPVLTASGGAR